MNQGISVQAQLKPNVTQKPTMALSPKRYRRQQMPLINAAEEFARNHRPTLDDMKKFKELFYTLIFQADAAVKKKLSTTLSRSHYTPRTIALFFAMDDIETAAPMLLFSPVLTTVDLNTLVEKNQAAHLAVIARRSDLQAATVKKLLSVKGRYQDIHLLLRKNTSLADDREIQDLLLLPVSSFPSHEITDEKEQVVTETVATIAPPETVEPTQSATEKLLELANAGRRLSAQHNQINGIYSETTEQFEKQLLDCARNSNKQAIAHAIEERFSLSSKKTSDIIQEQDAGMLACLLCAIGISKMTASQLLLLLNNQVGRNISVFREVMKEFDQLHRSQCEALFEKMGARFNNPETSQRIEEPGINFNQKLIDRRRNFATPQLGHTRLPDTLEKLRTA